jgi:phosphoglycerate dehydrogenase-like enzyme
MIGKRELAMMKPGAVLVNMSRGTVVDEIALTEALSFGGLEGVALDVFENEPLPSDSPLVQFPNVLLSPHMSAHTKEALERTEVEVAIAVKKALSGKPMRYLANPEVLKRTILRR